MSQRVEEFLEQASSLSISERAEIVTRLIDGLDENSDPGAEDAWNAEIELRLAEDDQGHIPSIPWDEAYEKLRKSRA